MITIKNRLYALHLVASVSLGLGILPAHAALVDEGTNSGLQCSGRSIDDSGREVGTCTNAVGATVAFFAGTPGGNNLYRR